jgi:hypothetical protein
MTTRSGVRKFGGTMKTRSRRFLKISAKIGENQENLTSKMTEEQ